MFLNNSLQPAHSVKSFSPHDVKYLKRKSPLKKPPGYDLITAEITSNLPKKATVRLTHVYNSIIRISYFPLPLKFSMIIIIQKPNNPPDSNSSNTRKTIS